MSITIVAGSLARLLATKLLLFLQGEAPLAIDRQLPPKKITPKDRSTTAIQQRPIALPRQAISQSLSVWYWRKLGDRG